MLKLKSCSIINRRNNGTDSKTKTKIETKATPSGRGGQKESRTTTKTTTKIIDEKPAGNLLLRHKLLNNLQQILLLKKLED